MSLPDDFEVKPRRKKSTGGEVIQLPGMSTTEVQRRQQATQNLAVNINKIGRILEMQAHVATELGYDELAMELDAAYNTIGNISARLDDAISKVCGNAG